MAHAADDTAMAFPAEHEDVKTTTAATKNKQQTFACPICNAVFTRKFNLKRHLNQQKNMCGQVEHHSKKTGYYDMLGQLLRTTRYPIQDAVLGTIWQACIIVSQRFSTNENKVHDRDVFEIVWHLLSHHTLEQVRHVLETILPSVQTGPRLYHALRRIHSHLLMLHDKGTQNLQHKSIPDLCTHVERFCKEYQSRQALLIKMEDTLG